MAWPPARARPARCSPATLIVHRLAVSAAAQYAGIDQAGSADQDALLRVYSAVAKRVQVNMNCLCREVRFASYGLPAGVGRGVSQCVRRVLAAQSPGPAVANRWARWSTSSTCSSPWLASGGVSGWLWPMTMSTPNGTHQRCDSVREAVAARWKPAWRPSWMAIEPTPPAAPITSRFLPAARPQWGWKGMRQSYSSQAVGGGSGWQVDRACSRVAGALAAVRLSPTVVARGCRGGGCHRRDPGSPTSKPCASGPAARTVPAASNSSTRSGSTGHGPVQPFNIHRIDRYRLHHSPEAMSGRHARCRTVLCSQRAVSSCGCGQVATICFITASLNRSGPIVGNPAGGLSRGRTDALNMDAVTYLYGLFIQPASAAGLTAHVMTLLTPPSRIRA